MFSIVIVVLSLAVAHAAEYKSIEKISKDLESFSETCPKTQYKVDGYSWSSCREGKTVVLGCISNTGMKMSFGEEYTDSQAKWRCSKDGNMVILEPIACVLSGKVVEIGQQRQKGKFFLMCTRKNNGLGLTIVGCADSDDKLVPLGSSYLKGKFMFVCFDDGQRVYEKGIGCIAEGQILALGEQMRSGDYFVECRTKGTRSVRLDIVGCSDDEGKLLNDGDTFSRKMVDYECSEEQQEGDKSGFRLTPIGCRTTDFNSGFDVSYPFGQTWLESYKENVAYQMECQQNGGLLGPKITACVFYPQSDKTVALMPGCGAVLDNHVLICKTDGRGVLARRKKISKGKTAAELFAGSGVKECNEVA